MAPPRNRTAGCNAVATAQLIPTDRGLGVMRILLLSVATLGLLLAGCSSPPAAGPDPAAVEPETFTVVGDNRVAAPAFTDMYHFLAQPDVTATPPDAYEPVRVRVQSLHERSVQIATTPPNQPVPPAPSWNFTLSQDLDGIVGTATVWVEVTGTVTGNPFSQPPTSGCFWALDALVDGYADRVTLGCLMEDLQVEPGIYELHLSFAHADLAFPAGSAFHVEFSTGEWVARSPGTTVEVLTGSIQYDSVLQLYGLRLPLEETLLST